MKLSSIGRVAILIVYVNNNTLTGDDVDKMERLKKCLASEFEINDLGCLRYFLGMDVVNKKGNCSPAKEICT